MHWISPINPWGKSVDLNEYVGIIRSFEYSKFGMYQTAYLVDKDMITQVKINGLFYYNFNELYNSINLKEIKHYDMNIWKYLKLLFTGRMKL
jgi:hypothetical protein